MTARTVVIEAQGLGKAYALFHRPQDRLKQMLVRGRRKYYDEYWALRDVSFTVRRGETVGVIGRNGSGKSTLLHLLCGTVAPSCGRIAVEGRVAALLELGAGFNPEFTGRENVHLAASILGLSNERINERYASIAEFAGIGDFIEQPVKLYSSGMYARLAFAVAAHVDADILIVDEILAVGDAAFTQKCMRFIHRFKERGTLFLVSHDIGQITGLCDTALWLDRGRLRAAGAAKDVCHAYLADLYQEQDDESRFRTGGERADPPPAERPARPDFRHDRLKESDRRNSIELFDFNPDAPWFGVRGASVTGVRMTTPDGAALPTLHGGEEVVLRVECESHDALTRPIIGFLVKDRLGQPLFGDNTFVAHQQAPPSIPAGRSFSASFRFQLPYLPVGDYAVTAAIAEGTQSDCVQHHWVDEAVFLKVVSSHVARGLVGVPMHAITFDLS